MAEILGIVAGATQLLDLSARLVLASSHLYTNLKNVPEEIETLKKNIQNFYDLLWMISSDLDGPLNSHPNSLHVTHRIVSIFNDAMKESEELSILLERLTNKSSSSVKRVWSSVAGLKERTEIADRGRRIESLKSSIQMWYHHQNNMRLLAVEQKLSTITYSQLATQSSLSLLTQQSARAIDINQSLATKLHSHHHAGVNMAELTPQQQRRSGRNRLCSCTPSITISHVSKWSFQLFLERKTTHLTDCPRHTDTTTWSFGLRALNPRIQAILGLQLGSWSFSMVGKISPHYIVDRSKSPAFVAMREARRQLKETRTSDGWNNRLGSRIETTTATSNDLTVLVYKESPLNLSYQRHIESTCTTLRSRLLQAFSSGTASPADRTPEGTTILSEFLDFALELVGYQEALFDLISSTVAILITEDTDSNSHLKQLLKPLMWKSCSIELQQVKMDGILISHALDELSDEFRGILSFTSFAGIFNKHPSLLENYGQNPVHLAIVQRSELKLRELLDLDKVDIYISNPPLLTLAVGWPAGLEMLLNAGADPLVAIEEAVLQQQLESIGLLLDHGCPMFGLYHGDILGFAVSNRVSPKVILLLIERLAGRRQGLLQVALDYLPEAVIEASWCNYHLRPGPLLDYNAVDIYDQLKAHGVEVSEALSPGPYPTVYHNPSVHTNSSLAIKLYELGFHDIDKSDDYGTTPLISAIEACDFGKNDCPRLIQWYLETGVTLDPQPFFTHILSRSTTIPMLISAELWINQEQKLYNMLETFRQLIHGDTQMNDDCRCWCSTKGCTPVGVVLRKSTSLAGYHSLPFHLLRRRRWLYLLPRYSSLGLNLDQSCFTEICRLEIFDRLGMAHTCCHLLKGWHQNSFHATKVEREEFQEEDKFLKKALDPYVELYLDLLHQHQESFESFWISWWFAVDHLLPYDFPSNSAEYFHPLHLPGFHKDELSSKAHNAAGYNPDVTALTSTVHACVIQLDSKAIDTFLNQLKAAWIEKSLYKEYLFNYVPGPN